MISTKISTNGLHFARDKVKESEIRRERRERETDRMHTA